MKARDLLTEAKSLVIHHLLKDDKDRRWCEPVHVDSYGNPDNRVELHVLEGSPPAGFVLVWRRRDGVVRNVVALDAGGRRLRAFHLRVVR